MENKSFISFSNQPKLSEHEVQSKLNERRITLIPLIQDFISNHERFKNKEVNVTFAHKGVSSLISIIETTNEKIVLKVPLSIDQSNNAEAQFLKVWEQAGVKVPHIIEEGVLGDHYYSLMEYIDAPILGETCNNKECDEKGIYFEMGHTLQLMHKPEAVGYGRVIDGRAEHIKFKDWISSEDIQKRIKYVQDNNLINDEHGSISLALKILTNHTDKENKSSYCHDDFGTFNIFATKPITVFDPNPRFNNGYLDIGRTLMLCISSNGTFPKQLFNGYFENKQCDEKVLHASILLNACIKFYYWNQVKKYKNIKNVQDYLIKNKYLLEN